MADKYMVSNSASGPWLELIATNNPQTALDNARAKMDWKVIWVAKMRPLKGEDIMPEPEMLWGEIMERLVTKHGSTAANSFAEDAKKDKLCKELIDAATKHMRDVESTAMVPAIKRPYGANQNVRKPDFTTIPLNQLIGDDDA